MADPARPLKTRVPQAPRRGYGSVGCSRGFQNGREPEHPDSPHPTNRCGRTAGTISHKRAAGVGKPTVLLAHLAAAIGRHVLSGDAIFADDSPVAMLAPGINALRAHLAEHGIVAPTGPAHVGRLAAVVDGDDGMLPAGCGTCHAFSWTRSPGWGRSLGKKIAGLDAELRRRTTTDDAGGASQSFRGWARLPRQRSRRSRRPWRPSRKAGTSPPGWASRRSSTRAAARTGWVEFRRGDSVTSEGC